MKKILFAMAVLLTTFTACTPEETPIMFTFSNTTFSESGNSTATKSMTTTITNTTDTEGSINWDLSETTAVTGWTYTITVDGTPQSGTSGSFDITGNQSLTIEVTIAPNGNAGTGVATLTFLENARTLGAVAYTYAATAAPAPPQFSLSVLNDSGSSNAANPMEYTTILTNLSSDSLEISWIRVPETTNPSSWQYTTCDHITCYAPFIDSRTYKIAGNLTINFKTEFRTNSVTGTGAVSTHFFLPSDSLGTVQTYTVTHTAN